MARNRTKPKKNQGNSPKQGHKLVWFTIIVISIPFLIIGYVVLTSMGGQGEPVVGNRFQKHDLDPKITEKAVQALQEQASTIEAVEEVTANLKSATLRIHLNMQDDASQEQIQAAADRAYEIINENLPLDQYFTNREDAKMYDLEIDSYNYIVDESHPAEGQIFIKITKTGASDKVNDVLTSPKDPDLMEHIKP